MDIALFELIFFQVNQTVSATKEIILSAGVFGTPQLLMLSGIGNKTTLNQFGIDSTVNLPSGMYNFDRVLR
jgi:choline dehydrogenase-like flavoprotein